MVSNKIAPFSIIKESLFFMIRNPGIFLRAFFPFIMIICIIDLTLYFMFGTATIERKELGALLTTFDVKTQLAVHGLFLAVLWVKAQAMVGVTRAYVYNEDPRPIRLGGLRELHYVWRNLLVALIFALPMVLMLLALPYLPIGLIMKVNVDFLIYGVILGWFFVSALTWLPGYLMWSFGAACDKKGVKAFLQVCRQHRFSLLPVMIYLFILYGSTMTFGWISYGLGSIIGFGLMGACLGIMYKKIVPANI